MEDKIIEQQDSVQNVVEVKKEELITDTDQLMDTIKNTDSIQDFLPIFNASIAKKQALRILKREDIIDKVADRIGERLDKRPDEITMTELNAIDKTMSEQKQKELGIINNSSDVTPITLTQQNNTVNVTVNSGTEKDSRERVIDAVKEMLKIATEGKKQMPSEDIVENTDVANTDK